MTAAPVVLTSYRAFRCIRTGDDAGEACDASSGPVVGILLGGATKTVPDIPERNVPTAEVRGPWV
jgi:hypothetical protein